MKSALEQWSEIRDRVQQSEHICLFLDYDGTVTPIVETPDKAILSDDMRSLLQQLAVLPTGTFVSISGRGLSDLKDKMKLENVNYIGSHGFEMESGDFNLNSLVSSRVIMALKEIKDEILKAGLLIDGILVEDKGIMMSVHYRLVDSTEEPAFLTAFERIVHPYLQAKELKLVKGKKVYELHPPIDWDKGKAVVWFLEQLKIKRGKSNIVPIYIGDDVPDEYAFSDLKDSGITIVVGKKKNSQAQYYLNDPAEVYTFLSEVLMVLKEKTHAN